MSLVSAALVWAFCANAFAYQWNYPAPVKTPAPGSDNGKMVLFDVSHGGTEGNADWVIDGAFSDFADALVSAGYTVKEYRGVDKDADGVIDFVDDYTNPSPSSSAANEAVITSAGIADADVLVLAESNRPFTQAEQSALEAFVQNGKGIFFISDHYNADRNLNSWDSTEVFNGYNRSSLSQFNIGGAYGDLRNPGSGTTGWLAQNFGIRFRFNAVDYKSGVSDIVTLAQSEGITQGVTPVLMAGGGTLAITDPSKAKGLVRFSPSDNPSPWAHAVDSGLYFGGQAEGPYVAIAKAGAGKAAFIGDSSPIEDNSPRYRRQDSGSVKTTYPGWTDAGNAAQLSINMVDWLATPENYTHFGSSAHPAGTATPNPKTQEEQSDPDNGQPWSSPSGGYQPWSPASFADGAYGAPNPVGGGSSAPTGGQSVSDALAEPNGTTLTVVGVITQAINGEYALEVADEHSASSTLYIKLESQYRDPFSPQNSPGVIGQTLEVTGTRDDYMTEPSIEAVTHMQLVQPEGSGCASSTSVSVSEAYASSIGTPLSVMGEVIGGVNDPYALELSDLNSSTTVYVKLESAQRAEFSPANNPEIIEEVIEVQGVRDDYMNYPSIESVSNLAVASGCP
ncbi:hypothetical protein [Marinimicrobium locisalis]|uniref:hypothetical protein n=1 Tax=Marinimicrobium locisalis TaxID=546022 RepID=UPI00322140FF